jgi:hypothetical protein
MFGVKIIFPVNNIELENSCLVVYGEEEDSLRVTTGILIELN